MQSKGAIRLFAIVFALVCLYQLSFTFIANRVEKNAKEVAAGDPEAERRYLDSIASEPVYNLLVRNYTYREVKDREINLGLDLQGGMNVTLEVSVVELIKELANKSIDPAFNASIARAVELQKTSQEDFVTLFGRAFNEIAPDAKLSSPTIFGTRELSEKIKPYESTNEEVLIFLRSEAEDAFEISFNVLRNRIDKFGVAQPNIQKLGNSGRILVELPGVKEKERVRKLLQGTAKLEFFETHENKNIYPLLEAANEVVKELKKEAGIDSTAIVVDEIQASAEQVAPQEELVQTEKEKPTLLEKLELEDTTSVSDTLAAEKNLQELAKEYPLFALLNPSGAEQGPVVGYALIRDTAKVNEYLNHKKVRAVFPSRTEFLWTVKAFDKEGKALQLIAINPASPDGKAAMEGDVITDARQTFGQFGATPEISMTMNAAGARKWRELTSNNIGKSIAIVLDDFVYSFPTVQGEISGGQSSITGNFSITEAKDLANVLKAGKLPAPARIVEEAVVGPSLGEESIRAGLISFVIALLLVLVYMVFYYNQAGLAANFALLANLFFIFGVLASLGAVLTLPGIAGIVLVIGMSVDANVLIFERIREELSTGKGLRLAIEDGYQKAYSSIIDANVTSLLTGIILYTFGTGPIRGFATVLIIGILTSLFAAIFLTRLIFLYRLDKNKSVKFFTKFTENAFKNSNFDFVSKRKIYYLISGIIITGGIISFAARGLNMGVDFVGGRSYVVRFDQDVRTIDLRSALTTAFDEAPEVKTFGGAQQVKITTKYLIDSQEEDAEQIVENKLIEGLSQFGDGNFEIMSSQKVGPTVANDIKAAAVWAILFSFLVIFLYIILRFKKWQFGLGALVAIFHDVLIVLACFSLFYGILPFSLEIDQAFIAAILTVIGYSINDTVVVFDRIREYLSTSRKREMDTLINEALNSTLSRTFNTSFTIFIVLIAIFIFGGEVIRGFSFALLIGIVVGTYSSICIATPIVIDFSKKPEELK
ncbi:MAG: protein translocase subunit SecDF [Bacteroidetes bacterium]|nr:protein translocase subunit SecDF [Bacteroidota bacterium]HET6245268.1 protein translocase subunit SecDF [Bacteroidia bacterium]